MTGVARRSMVAASTLGGTTDGRPEPAAQHCGNAGTAYPMAPATPAEARGRFFNTGNGFNVQLPPVPDRIFATNQPERSIRRRDRADRVRHLRRSGMPVSGNNASGSGALSEIGAGETLSTDFIASGMIAYAITGSGTTQCAGQEIAWNPGDLFILPGGEPPLHAAGDTCRAMDRHQRAATRVREPAGAGARRGTHRTRPLPRRSRSRGRSISSTKSVATRRSPDPR